MSALHSMLDAKSIQYRRTTVGPRVTTFAEL